MLDAPARAVPARVRRVEQMKYGIHRLFFVLVQTKMSWRALLTSQYSRLPLGIEVQSCPVLR